jgi:uncharacterized protein YndB with AHSA1/START domain
MTHPLQGTLENRDDAWVLTLVRDFAHPPEKVWPWLVDPDRLRRWSPIVPDRAFDSVGPRQVRDNPDDEPFPGDVLSVDPPRELVHRWGEDTVRWRLEQTDTGCRLTLEQTMRERDKAAMNAAGWHLCLDVLEGVMDGADRPRVVGPDAMKHGWEPLRDKYSEALGV